MPLEAYIFIFTGLLIGVASGLMPTVGVTVSFIILWPWIMTQPFDAVIAFMMVVHTGVFFSASVGALWLGVAGDPTTFPILSERKNIPYEQYGSALKRTAQASAISSIISIIFTSLVIDIASDFIILFIKTITTAIIIFIMIVVAVFWRKNNILLNIFLIFAGITVGLVGWQDFLNTGILIFNNPYLYNGIPLMPVLLGLYAIPILFETFFESMNNHRNKTHKNINDSFLISKKNVSLGPVARGGLTGFIIGLIPMIGGTVCSNVAWEVESYFSKDKKTGALNRITASESANNAAAAAILAPLLILGIAIVPSETIILSIIKDQGWSINSVTIDTLFLIIISVVLSCATLYVVCVKYALHLLKIFHQYQLLILAVFVVIMLYGIYFNGNLILQGNFFLTVFGISCIIGTLLKKLNIDVIPFMISMLIGNISIPIVLRVLNLLGLNII